MLAALGTARRIDFSAYVLWRGPVERALEGAAARGAEVHVRLEARLFHPSAKMRADNVYALRRLRALGADAKAVDRTDAAGPALHLKAAVCDGAAYLDDCNWNAGDAVIRDADARDVAALRVAALHQPAVSLPGLALNKADALDQEARTLENTHAARVDVETEAINKGAVATALRDLAKRGVHCRLLLSSQCIEDYHQTAALLQKAGVEVRVVEKSEKFAVAGGSAWIGSADATSAYRDGDRIDWGISTRDSSVAGALQNRFTSNWRKGRPLSTPVTPSSKRNAT